MCADTPGDRVPRFDPAPRRGPSRPRRFGERVQDEGRVRNEEEH
ncbi:hypothetical protein [Spirillospora sp. NPDC048824]